MQQRQATKQLRRSLKNPAGPAVACDVSSEQLSTIIRRGASSSRAEQPSDDKRGNSKETLHAELPAKTSVRSFSVALALIRQFCGWLNLSKRPVRAAVERQQRSAERRHKPPPEPLACPSYNASHKYEQQDALQTFHMAQHLLCA